VTRPEEALFNLVQESLEDQSSGSFGQPTLPATSRQNDKFIPSRSTDTFAAFRNPSTQPPTANRRPPLAAPFSRKPAAKPFSNVESLALATLVEPEDAVNPDLEYEYYYDYLDTPDTAHKADYDLVPLANKVRIQANGVPHCLDVGVFPHPFSCKQFVNCFRNPGQGITGSIYKCPSYLAFDPVGGRCNWVSEIVCAKS